MALLDEQGFPHEGEVDFVDNRLNPQTGAIRMRATFDNAEGRFTPGLSARLRMESATAHDAVLVPERAIGTDQTKKFVSSSRPTASRSSARCISARSPTACASCKAA